jgi:hypothetical protein
MAWIGPVGALLQLTGTSTLRSSSTRPTSYRTTLGGVRKAQLGPRAHRQLEVQHGAVRPAELAALAALVGGEFGPGPFWYVDPWAEVTNLLAPAASLLEPGTWNSEEGTAVSAGPHPLEGGGVVGRSVVPGSLTDLIRIPYRNGSLDRLPVIPGRVVTASIHATGAVGEVLLRIHWLNVAGGSVGLSIAYHAVPGSDLHRIAVSGTVPPGAVAMYVSVLGATRIARPAVTWSEGVLPWFPGQGLPRAVISGLDQEAILAAAETDGQIMAGSFTVMEVG